MPHNIYSEKKFRHQIVIIISIVCRWASEQIHDGHSLYLNSMLDGYWLLIYAIHSLKYDLNFHQSIKLISLLAYLSFCWLFVYSSSRSLYQPHFNSVSIWIGAEDGGWSSEGEDGAAMFGIRYYVYGKLIC